MCWTCPCGDLEDDHGEAACLTTADMQAAANQIDSDIPHVVSNIVLALSHFNPDLAKEVMASTTPYAGVRVVKASDERRYTLGVAYPAMKTDVSRAADGHRDFVSPEALEKTAWEWMDKRRAINLFHKSGDQFDGHGTVVESYIYRGPDWTVDSPVDGKPYVIKAGDWLMGCQWSDYAWALVKAGLVNGWSPEGSATRTIPTPERLATVRS